MDGRRSPLRPHVEIDERFIDRGRDDLDAEALRLGAEFSELVGVALAWSLSIVGTLLILFVVDKLMGLRVSESDEREGLDISQHGEEGYDWNEA